jgi:hypothetical protein
MLRLSALSYSKLIEIIMAICWDGDLIGELSMVDKSGPGCCNGPQILLTDEMDWSQKAKHLDLCTGWSWRDVNVCNCFCRCLAFIFWWSTFCSLACFIGCFRRTTLFIVQVEYTLYVKCLRPERYWISNGFGFWNICIYIMSYFGCGTQV